MTQIYNSQPELIPHLWADWYERYGISEPREERPIDLQIDTGGILENDMLYLLGLMQPPVHPLQNNDTNERQETVG